MTTQQALPVTMPAVQLVNGIPKTTSMGIADHFKKRHSDVLRSIQTFDVPEDFRQRNFALSSYITQQGKEQPMYLITRDGFTILAMGFTGKQAMEWKIKYIAAFNLMEAELHKSATQPQRPLLTWERTRTLEREMEHRFIREHGKPILFSPIWRFTQRITTSLLAHFRVSRLDQIPDDCFEEARELIRNYFDPPRTYTSPMTALYPKGLPHQGNNHSLVLTSIPGILARMPQASPALALLRELAADGNNVAGARREIEEVYTALRWLHAHVLDLRRQFDAIENFGTSIRVHHQIS